MLDLKFLRASPDKARQAAQSRGEKHLQLLDELIAADQRCRAALNEVEALRAASKKISAEVGKYRAKKEAVPEAVQSQANAAKEALAAKEAGLAPVQSEVDKLALGVANLPHESVPRGVSGADNVLVREDVSCRREFKFKPLDHHALGEKLGILDFAAAAKLSGSRFALLKGAGARLERAIISFMLDQHIKNGYLEVFPPYMVTAETMTGTGQLPKFEEELYKLCSEPAMYMIPTAEVPLTNMFRDAMLKETELPVKMTAYTPCFRQEAGSYGKDTRGLIRNHQFNKIELVWITKPEESMPALERLTQDAETLLKLLGIPHRVMALCTGDMGFASCKTYDIEVWMPSENGFKEISSCSNCWDFQARRMGARFKRGQGGAPELVHTLNGSGLAVGRTFAAILENYQNEDGSVSVPPALVPYFGADKISAA